MTQRATALAAAMFVSTLLAQDKSGPVAMTGDQVMQSQILMLQQDNAKLQQQIAALESKLFILTGCAENGIKPSECGIDLEKKIFVKQPKPAATPKN